MPKLYQWYRRVALWGALKVLRGYQVFISPLFGPCCRFYPSCSRYGVEALKTHGLMHGGWLTLKRLAKCGPFHPGGVDLVPPKNREGGKRRPQVFSLKNQQCSCESTKNMAENSNALKNKKQAPIKKD